MKMISLFKKYPIYSILLFCLPFLIGMQPFFPKGLQSLLINFRLVILPIFLIVRFYREFNIVLLVLLILYLFFLRMFTIPSNENDFILVLLSLLSSITFFKFGHYVGKKSKINEVYIFLVHGITCFNLCTLLIYYSITVGAIDVITFFELTQKELSEGVFRFSIGNPIELPLTICSLFYASLLLLPNRKPQLFSSSLNLILTFISQSRIVVVIALLIFVVEFWQSSRSRKLLVLSLIFVFILYVHDDALLILESFVQRLSGEDLGSMDDRSFLYDIAFQYLNIINLIIGSGLTSSSMLLHDLTGSYRTIESVFLQFLFELGIIGTGLLFLTFFLGKKSIAIPSFRNIIIILFWIQILFFSSIYTLMPFAFFLFGITSRTYNNHKTELLFSNN